MDFSLREWLMIIGPLLIVAVVLHGYIRMRMNRNQLTIQLDKTFQSTRGEDHAIDELDLLKAELPSGGARVVSTDGLSPLQGNLELEEDVPVLMDSVSPAPKDEGALVTASQAGPPAQDESPDQPNGEAVGDGEHGERTGASERTPQTGDTDSDDLAEPGEERVPDGAPGIETDNGESEAPDAASANSGRSDVLLVINVLSREGQFAGETLRAHLDGAGLVHGAMNIFHRHAEGGEARFSVASAVEPGTFDPARWDQFSTPGLAIFMRIGGHVDPHEVFDEMLGFAERSARDLGGVLRDEKHREMTPETIGQYRDTIDQRAPISG